MIKKINLRAQLIIFFLLLSIIPLVLSSFGSYLRLSDTIEDEVFSKLTQVTALKKDLLSQFFEEHLQNIASFAQNSEVCDNMKRLNDIYLYNGLEDKTRFDTVREIYGKQFEKYVEAKEYANLLKIAPDGSILYSATDQNIFGENILTGKLQGTAVTDIFQKAASGELAVSDLTTSLSSDTRAMYIAHPIYKYELFIGVLVFEFSIDGINELCHKTSGLESSQEIYLIGSDSLMRSDSRIHENALALNQEIPNELLEKIYSEEQGTGVFNNYNDQKMLTSFSTIQISDLNWAIVAEIDTDEAFKPVRNLQIFYFTLIGIVIIAIVILGTFIANLIHKPIKKLTHIAHDMAEYNFTHDFEDVKRKDEIGELLLSFKQMSNNVCDLILQLKNALQKVLKTTNNIVEISDQNTEAGNQLSEIIQGIADRTSDQASNTEKGLDNINTLGNKISEIVSSYDQILDVSNKSNSITQEGLETMQNLNEKNKQTSEYISNNQKISNSLQKKSEDIGQITELISNIADQTNLLALNAAIEAARAGQNGLGFTVVAEEIRELATKSVQAAQDISDLIASIQDEIKLTVENINVSKKLSEEQDLAVTETKSHLESIASGNLQVLQAIKDATNVVQLIEQNSHGTTDSMNGIYAMAEEVAASTEEASATSEEQTAAMEELNQLIKDQQNITQELQELVAKFKITD